MDAQNLEGSNKASSYVRALELLGPILAKRSRTFTHCSDLFATNSVSLIGVLYAYIREQQNLGDMGIFDSKSKPSYWRNGFYSAALKSYKEFLILQRHQDDLWEIYNEPGIEPKELGKRLNCSKFEAAKSLLSEVEFDVSTREGKEALRQIKARVNQEFFRAMILHDYGVRCCLTGLTIPGVLRASHIVGWAEDADNRMNPANGLCLSATYDAAFDRHLIAFDDDFRMILSPSLKEFYTNDAFKKYFLSLEGQRICLPKKYKPDTMLLERHRSKIM